MMVGYVDLQVLFMEMFGKHNADSVFDYLVEHTGQRVWSSIRGHEFDCAWIENDNGDYILYYMQDLEDPDIVYL
jgi:aryl-phospho-beta-D-glucosidase BglC (GH1 family)